MEDLPSKKESISLHRKPIISPLLSINFKGNLETIIDPIIVMKIEDHEKIEKIDSQEEITEKIDSQEEITEKIDNQEEITERTERTEITEIPEDNKEEIDHKEITDLKEILKEEIDQIIDPIMIETMVIETMEIEMVEVTIDLKEETTTDLMTEISIENKELIMLSLENIKKKGNRTEREELLSVGSELLILDQLRTN